MRRQDQRIYEFVDFRLDLNERTLSRGGEVILLRPKLFELLVFLIENRGQILEKDEITRAVWGGTSQGSPDSPSANLNVNISNLRHELGDDPEKPMLIETLKGRGYRFLPLVRVIESPPAISTHSYLSAVGAASGVRPALLPSLDDEFEAKRFEQPERPAAANARASSIAEEERTASASAASGRNTTFHGWMLIAAAIVISALALAVWTVTKIRSNRAAEIVGGANFAANHSSEKPSSNAGDPAGVQFHGSQIGDASAVQPQIDSIEPASPPAWIGDKQIKINGRGFRPGLSVMMVFPGGGSGANLSGAAVLNVTPESFVLLADFNNNPGEYRIRVDLADGSQSDWWTFDVLPANFSPEIDEVKEGRAVNGKRQIVVNGRNFLQHVHAALIHPDGYKEHLRVSRPSANTFYVFFDPRGQTGPFSVQAQNAGKGSNVVSFHLSQP